MPCTVENRIIRSFKLEGDYAGAEAVDFWTRVSVLGFDTRTYTLTLEGKNWLQQSAFRLGGRKTMEEVTQGIRKALIVKE